MPFNSQTAKEAGKKSKRGKAKHSSEIREMLNDLATQTLNNINTEQLTNSERIALLRILINYTVPKLQTERSETTEHKEFTVKVL
jgi:hypothetical protein